MEKRDWNVPCLLLRWSRCLLCWCSFLRWQEDLGGRGEPWWINWLWQLLISHSRAAAIDVVEHYSLFEGISLAEGLCLPAQCRWGVPKHQKLGATHQQDSDLPLCASLTIWPPAGRSCACFYPNTHHEGSLGPAKSLMLLTELNPIKHPWDIAYCWIHCCHHTTAAPAQAVQELTDVLIRVWEEISRETISRLIRSVPGRGERVQAGRRPHTLLSYIRSGLDWTHGRVISLWSHFLTLIMSESATSLMERVACLVSTGLTVTTC